MRTVKKVDLTHDFKRFIAQNRGMPNSGAPGNASNSNATANAAAVKTKTEDELARARFKFLLLNKSKEENKLRFAHTTFTDEMVEELVKIIKENKIVSLTFRTCVCSKFDVLLNAIANNTSLKWVAFDFVAFEAKDIIAFVKLIETTKNLHSLTFSPSDSSPPITTAEGLQIGQALAKNTTLISLDLFGSSLDSKTVLAIADALKINNTLYRLVFDSRTSIEELKAIHEALKNNKRIILFSATPSEPNDAARKLLIEEIEAICKKNEETQNVKIVKDGAKGSNDSDPIIVPLNSSVPMAPSGGILASGASTPAAVAGTAPTAAASLAAAAAPSVTRPQAH